MKVHCGSFCGLLHNNRNASDVDEQMFLRVNSVRFDARSISPLGLGLVSPRWFATWWLCSSTSTCALMSIESWTPTLFLCRFPDLVCLCYLRLLNRLRSVLLGCYSWLVSVFRLVGLFSAFLPASLAFFRFYVDTEALNMRRAPGSGPWLSAWGADGDGFGGSCDRCLPSEVCTLFLLELVCWVSFQFSRAPRECHHSNSRRSKRWEGHRGARRVPGG